MRGLVYSDIHHHLEYPSGVTLQDTLAVEDQICSYLAEHKLDFFIFCGDRFERKDPADKVKTAADLEMVKKNDLLCPGFYLLGNHDYYYKNREGGDSLDVVDVFSARLPYVVVMDRPMTYSHEKCPKLLVHALPYGEPFVESNYKPDPNKLNLLAVHQTFDGAIVDVSPDGGEFRLQTSNAVSQIDMPWIDTVVAGDIHIPQPLPLKNTKGGYIGSTLQLKKREAGDARGWIVLDANGKELGTEFVQSAAPRFINLTLKDVGENPCWLDGEPTIQFLADLDQITHHEWEDVLEGNFLELTVPFMVTTAQTVALKKALGVRDVTVLSRVSTAMADIPIDVELNTSVGPLDDVERLLKAGAFPLDGLDKKVLLQKIDALVRQGE